MAIWMLYIVAVTLLLGAAALALEYALRLYGRPLRWIWYAVVAASLALPLALHTLLMEQSQDAEGLLGRLDLVAVPMNFAAPPPSSHVAEAAPPLTQLEVPLLILWALSSLAVLAFYGRSHWRISRLSRGWVSWEWGERRVRVSSDVGPAVMGVFRSLIVVPAWVLQLEERVRRLVFLHEEEHLRAGDHRLLHAAAIPLMVMPWNPALWWIYRRLRLAVELDCDRRVLRRGADPRSYGQLLLEVGRRRSRAGWLPGPALRAESFLGKRLQAMSCRTPPGRGRRTALALVATVATLALAYAAPRPVQPLPAVQAFTLPSLLAPWSSAQEDSYTLRVGSSDPSAEVQFEGRFTFADGKGEIEITQGLTPFEYQATAELRSARFSSQSPKHYLKVDLLRGDRTILSGVGEVLILSGRADLPAQGHSITVLPLEAAGPPEARTQPQAAQETAKLTGVVVDVETGIHLPGVQIYLQETGRGALTADNGRYFIVNVPPGTYTVWAEGEGYRSRRIDGVTLTRGETVTLDFALRPVDLRPPEPPDEPAEGPHFTPFTVKPELTNRAEAARTVERVYPPALQEAGVGGQVIIWIYVDETGVVRNSQIHESSGYPELDAAARRAVQVFEFTPARNRNKVVPVWIAIPITFTAR